MDEDDSPSEIQFGSQTWFNKSFDHRHGAVPILPMVPKQTVKENSSGKTMSIRAHCQEF